jgi:putative transposase
LDLDHFWLVFSGAFSWLRKERKTMKAAQFSCAQKAFILKQGDEGVSMVDLPEGSEQPGDLFQLEEKIRGILPPEMQKLKQHEDENARLKKIEPPRLCRRPQLVRSRVYDKQNDEQIFS